MKLAIKQEKSEAQNSTNHEIVCTLAWPKSIILAALPYIIKDVVFLPSVVQKLKLPFSFSRVSQCISGNL